MPTYWLNKASDLRAAAGAVWYCMGHATAHRIPQELDLGEGFDMRVATFPVYVMLCGMSLELILKAVIVVKGGTPGAVHDLVALAGKAGVSLDTDESGLLALLTEYVVWYGRYPAPRPNREDALIILAKLTEKHLYAKQTHGQGLTILSPRRPGPLDWDQYNRLWSRIGESFWELYS